MRLILAITTLLLTACAPMSGKNSYRDALADLRSTSLQEADRYARETDAFLQINGEQKTIEAASAAVKRGLKDPDSAKLQNIRLTKYAAGKVVCGEVNGKNSYGGYVGYRRFIASAKESTIFSTGNKHPEIDAAANTGIFSACGL